MTYPGLALIFPVGQIAVFSGCLALFVTGVLRLSLGSTSQTQGSEFPQSRGFAAATLAVLTPSNHPTSTDPLIHGPDLVTEPR